MDGISVAANIIAIISAAQLAAQGLQKLYSLRKAPQQVLLLLGEVSDLETVLSIVQETYEQLLLCNQFQNPVFNQYLARTISKASAALDEVNQVIESGLIKNLDDLSVERVKISWRTWLRRHGYLTLVSSKLRDVKTDIASALTFLTASEVPRLRKNIDGIFLDNGNIVDGLISLGREIAPLSPTIEKLQSTLDYLQQPKLSTELELPSNFERESLNRPQYSQKNGGCYKWCLCCCHERKSLYSPLWTQSLFGQLFLAYSGKALSRDQKCNFISCQEWKSKEIILKATYIFPSWLLQRVLVISDRWSPVGHVISVRTPRLIPDNPIFYAALMGKIHTLQKLFEDGAGSPFDTRGGTRTNLLSFAVAMKRTETCRFLLQNHADPEQEDNMSRSALDRVTTFLIVDPLNPIHVELKQIFLPYLDVNESVGKRSFSNLHKIVLGLTTNPIDLEAYLQLSTAEIESRCSLGRTPLMWVAGTSRTREIKMLLKYGAKIDSTDNLGINVLHRTSSSDSGDIVESLKILLEAAASNPSILKEMLNKMHGTGSRPLDSAAANGKSAQVALYLSYGASTEPQLPHPDAIAAIFYAIDSNFHEIIELLLKAGAKTDVKDKLQKSLLHVIAEDGDLKTIGKFARVQPPMAIETRDVDVFGVTPMELFEKHCDNFASRGEMYNAKRRRAFVELLEQIDKSYLEKHCGGDSSRIVECVDDDDEGLVEASKFLDVDGSKIRDETDSSDESQCSDESETFFDASTDPEIDIYEKIGFAPPGVLDQDHFSLDVKEVLG